MVPVLCAKERRDLLKLEFDRANDFVNEIRGKSSKALTFKNLFSIILSPGAKKWASKFHVAIQNETLNLSSNLFYVGSRNNIQVTYHDSLQPWGNGASLPKEL